MRGDGAEGEVDLDDAGERTDEGVPERDGAAVVTHDAGADGESAERPTPRGDLDDHGDDERGTARRPTTPSARSAAWSMPAEPYCTTSQATPSSRPT